MSRQAHGHTTAAWTGVTISFVGFCIAGVGMIMANAIIVVGGLVVAAAAGAVGLAMKAAGMGKQPDPQVEKVLAEFRELRASGVTAAAAGSTEAVTAGAH
ncbi:HGxxPAAW family protein [Kitasatospora sp. NPDC006697]|uniref:HGxxPAAW family protein n=1 Tax=Kitasatospora sp. NPDC006697 TaxID=3364020 RepID=UPI0036C6156F